jgi:acetyl-CoA acetyltransferase family protein
MRHAVIVDAVRTPGGKRNGQLSGWHPVDLAAETLRGVVAPSGLDPTLIDDVYMGCVTQVGAQSLNVGRNAVLAAGWPEETPATTIDRQCGSSQQAIHFAAQSIMAGASDIIVAAGVECMSTVPMFSSADGNIADPYGPLLRVRYGDRNAFGDKGLIQQGLSAEIVADQWSLSREDLDHYGLMSQERAALARDLGYFSTELVPVAAKVRDPSNPELVKAVGDAVSDEGIRDTSLEKLADLKPAFQPDGKVTAGNSSQIADGAAACLIMSDERARSLGLRPRAIVRNFAVAGVDPVVMLTGPIAATRKLLDRSDLTIGQIDLFEVNEAFASVVLAWAKELGADLRRVNVNGGGIALGHPLGASGTKLMATLVHELERREGRYGILTMCEAGGMANATLIERVPA